MSGNNLEFVTPVSSDGGSSPSLFISPPESEGGLPAELVNARPQLNLSYINTVPNSPYLRPQLNEALMGQQRARGFAYPATLRAHYPERNTLESRYWGEAPFFINAKPRSMLERGWVRAKVITLNSRGLVRFEGGPEVVVTVKAIHKTLPGKYYTMLDTTTGETFVLNERERYSAWDFYNPVRAVPFVPRGGSKKTRRGKKKSRKMRR